MNLNLNKVGYVMDKQIRNIVFSLEFLGDYQACYDSWVLGKGVYSSGWLEEIETLASCGFFGSFLIKIDDFKFSNELKNRILGFVPRLDRYIIRVHDELKYEDLKFLQKEEWQAYSEELSKIAKQIRFEYPNLPERVKPVV
jgi:hypothetical protein